QVVVEGFQHVCGERAFPLLAAFTQVAHGAAAAVVGQGADFECQRLAYPQAEVSQQPQQGPVPQAGQVPGPSAGGGIAAQLTGAQSELAVGGVQQSPHLVGGQPGGGGGIA